MLHFKSPYTLLTIILQTITTSLHDRHDPRKNGNKQLRKLANFRSDCKLSL